MKLIKLINRRLKNRENRKLPIRMALVITEATKYKAIGYVSKSIFDRPGVKRVNVIIRDNNIYDEESAEYKVAKLIKEALSNSEMEKIRKDCEEYEANFISLMKEFIPKAANVVANEDDYTIDKFFRECGYDIFPAFNPDQK